MTKQEALDELCGAYEILKGPEKVPFYFDSPPISKEESKQIRKNIDEATHKVMNVANYLLNHSKWSDEY